MHFKTSSNTILSAPALQLTRTPASAFFYTAGLNGEVTSNWSSFASKEAQCVRLRHHFDRQSLRPATIAKRQLYHKLRLRFSPQPIRS